MTVTLQNDLILRAARREPTERTPVWMMRQAGRYLPEYRAVRKKADFLTMCKTPALAAEVTVQPVDIVGVDAAIIFSDILTIPEAMGLQLEFVSGRGPVFESPVRNQQDVDNLKTGVLDDLRYVGYAIEETVKNLDGRVPVIGFAGSPWTLASYMIEGGSSKHYKVLKKLMYSQPDLLKSLLDKLVAETIEYLSMQVDAGADILQLFDSWGGILASNMYDEFSLTPLKTIIQGVKNRHPDIPMTIFSKGARTHITSQANAGADVISLDWMADLGTMRKQVDDTVALQGNLDPAVLLTDPLIVEEQTKQMLKSYGKGAGHIANLGHGITPKVPVENAKAFIDTVKSESVKYHQ